MEVYSTSFFIHDFIIFNHPRPRLSRSCYGDTIEIPMIEVCGVAHEALAFRQVESLVAENNNNFHRLDG